jgi:hypothetical protein
MDETQKGASSCDNRFDGYAECAVCWSDTPLLCGCGDPVCDNCGCPNGCDADARQTH